MKVDPLIEKLGRAEVVWLVAESIAAAEWLSEAVKLDAVAIAERAVEVFDANDPEDVQAVRESYLGSAESD